MGDVRHFFSCLSFLSSFSLSTGDGPIWAEILSQRARGPLSPKQPANLKWNVKMFRILMIYLIVS